MTQKKLFIVFDGIDGDGKTTQVMLLKEYLEKRGFKVFSTSEPTNSEYGKQIDNLLRQKFASRVSKEKWLELFTKDSKEDEKLIKSALDSEQIVIADRYIYSTLAYQLEEKEWQSYTEQFIKPDLVFILDLPIKVAIERIKKKYEKTKEKKSYFEKTKILREVKKKFLELPRFLNHNIKIIDSNRKIEEIFNDIKKEVELLLH
ncbi:MAG: dTMP kinase [Candidatus Pacearchaeota archaeon]